MNPWMVVGAPNYAIPQVNFGQNDQQQQPKQGQQQDQQGLAQLLLKYLQNANKPSLDQIATNNAVNQQVPQSAPPAPSGDNLNSTPQQPSLSPTDYWQLYNYLSPAPLTNANTGMSGGY